MGADDGPHTENPEHPEQTWGSVRDTIRDDTFLLGPMFAHQILDKPRHLLFTLARYKFPARMLPNDRTVDVLELGCSEGVGTALLAEGGHRVVGVDFDEAAIAHAQSTLGGPTMSFVRADFLGERFGEFHAVVSLDVIEHIERQYEDEFVRTASLNLEPDGFCVIGTPNDTASEHASPQSQAGHVNLYTAERLAALMRRHFRHVFMFGMNDEVLHTGFYPMCHYLLALGCGPVAPSA